MKIQNQGKKIFILLRRVLKIMIYLAAAGFVSSLIINITMVKSMEKYIYSDIGEIPSRSAVMVLGAQIRGKTLSPILQDRVNGGIALIQTGRGKKLLLSGDHGQIYYDEVNAMRLYVLEHAPEIPEEDIFMDHAGFSTWDSMYRARDVFEVSELLIVTQKFHISRAVCMARSLGIDAVGYGLGEEHFNGKNLEALRVREYFARIKALYSIVFNIKPRYLGDKIPITGNGRDTWI